jgi:hypothetical protein
MALQIVLFLEKTSENGNISHTMWGKIFRPRIKLQATCTRAEAIESFQQRLESTDLPVVGMVSRRLNHAEMRIHRDVRHFWSPYMSIAVEEGDDGSVVHGQIGPHPSLWVFFAFVYITSLSGACIGLVFGLSQWSLGLVPWALWILPGATIVCLVLYLISRFGQGLAESQMQMMESFLRDSLQPDAEADST